MIAAVLKSLPVALFACSAVAQEPGAVMDAGNLLEICKTANPDAVGFCNGFMQAAHDWPAGEEWGFCLPLGTTRTQLAMLYEREAPALFARFPDVDFAHQPAIVVARVVLALEYPCAE